MRKRIALLVTACVVLLLAASRWADSQQGGVAARARGILDVMVLDENGKRLKGATVAVPGYRSVTGVGGTCRFSLYPGRYSVLINKAGYRGRRINAGVKPDETTTVRIQLEKLPAKPSPKG